MTASLASQLPKTAHCQGHTAATVNDFVLIPDGLAKSTVNRLCGEAQTPGQCYCSSTVSFVQFLHVQFFS